MVMPDTGLLDEPTRPAMYADTEQNRNPATTMMTAIAQARLADTLSTMICSRGSPSGSVNSTMPMSTHFIGRSRSVCATLRVAAGARRGEAALHARDDGIAQRDQRPQAADQHGARRRDSGSARRTACRAVVSAHSALRQALAGRGNGGRELRIVGQEIRVVDRDRDVEGQDAARQHHDADVESDDVTHAEQRGRQVGADVAEVLADESRWPQRAVGNEAQAARRRRA